MTETICEAKDCNNSAVEILVYLNPNMGPYAVCTDHLDPLS